MTNLHSTPATVNSDRRPTFPNAIPTPTRGDMIELLAAIVADWDRSESATDFMERVTPQIRQARAFVDEADLQRITRNEP